MAKIVLAVVCCVGMLTFSYVYFERHWKETSTASSEEFLSVEISQENALGVSKPVEVNYESSWSATGQAYIEDILTVEGDRTLSSKLTEEQVNIGPELDADADYFVDSAGGEPINIGDDIDVESPIPDEGAEQKEDIGRDLDADVALSFEAGNIKAQNIGNDINVGENSLFFGSSAPSKKKNIGRDLDVNDSFTE
jgi:hypothetical protein